MDTPPAVLLDVDGTLVDSNYFHTLAWFRAFRRGGREVQMTTIHHLIGMGSDQLLDTLIGGPDENLATWWGEEFAPLRDEILPTPGAARLVQALSEAGATTVFATSGEAEDVEAMRKVIGADQWLDAVVNASEVESSKPSPDIFQAALDKVGAIAANAMVIGDTVWDIKAAAACGLPCIAVLTGGITRAELEGAGAAAVYDSPQHLLDEISTSPLADLLA